ncbi:hypothetical protein FB451DRAFT_1184201 [Mycena latifolia]|nr:hypothetical protein FB451DRAFT_1184201 [Mycena latifolia]
MDGRRVDSAFCSPTNKLRRLRTTADAKHALVCAATALWPTVHKYKARDKITPSRRARDDSNRIPRPAATSRLISAGFLEHWPKWCRVWEDDEHTQADCGPNMPTTVASVCLINN